MVVARPFDKVSIFVHLSSGDFSRSRFELSTLMWWIRMVGVWSVVDGEWFGWLKCVRHRALALSVLIRLVFS